MTFSTNNCKTTGHYLPVNEERGFFSVPVSTKIKQQKTNKKKQKTRNMVMAEMQIMTERHKRRCRAFVRWTASTDAMSQTEVERRTDAMSQTEVESITI
jgi:hypothetical protein